MFLVLMMELSLITPPVGMNLYVVQGVRGAGSASDVYIGVTPFIRALFAVIALVIAFPQIALFLPNLLY